MRKADANLVTPIYFKTEPDGPWPEDSVFYVLASNGLFRCRKNEFFTSCVAAPDWPRELKPQQPFLRVSYPKLPQLLVELCVGFFSAVFKRHSSESVALVVWDRTTRRMSLRIPPQEATVSYGWYGKAYPMDVRYTLPTNLPAGQYVLADIHCHGDGYPDSSWADQQDEEFKTGLHIVVGRITEEPPRIKVEAVVDGKRFVLAPETVMEKYVHRRMNFPGDWLGQVKVKPWNAARPQPQTGQNDRAGHGGAGYVDTTLAKNQDKYMDKSRDKDWEAGGKYSTRTSPAQQLPVAGKNATGVGGTQSASLAPGADNRESAMDQGKDPGNGHKPDSSAR